MIATDTFVNPAQQYGPGGLLGGRFPRRISTPPHTAAGFLLGILLPSSGQSQSRPLNLNLSSTSVHQAGLSSFVQSHPPPSLYRRCLHSREGVLQSELEGVVVGVG
jgi:hypothetical protein